MSVISQQSACNVDRHRVGLLMHYVMVLRCHFNVVRVCNRHVPRRSIDRVSIGKESLRFQDKRQNIHNIFVPKCQSAVTLRFISRGSNRYVCPGFFSCLPDSETSIAIRITKSDSVTFICIHMYSYVIIQSSKVYGK